MGRKVEVIHLAEAAEYREWLALLRLVEELSRSRKGHRTISQHLQSKSSSSEASLRPRRFLLAFTSTQTGRLFELSPLVLCILFFFVGVSDCVLVQLSVR